ncbi:hypothetical protein LEP1GSC037_2620 [Leptospira interrogans str. 2006001854]|uniref:Uncharacterized protein n=1 Tax=Leptospira interrogans str. 2006001854 TaxID=1001590 RepID=M6GFV4_LEPIR|nr:hypothetical protein LEP1GSC037_2620 [Leptospira interrogans str. 2006001854]
MIAILLLTYQLQKRIYGVFAFKNLFYSFYIRAFIFLHAFVIILSIYSIATIGNKLLPHQTATTYYILFLFVVLIIFLFPFSKK